MRTPNLVATKSHCCEFSKSASKSIVFYTCFGLVLGVTLAIPARAGGNDDPFLTMVKVDQLEWRDTDGPDPIYAEGEAWVGYDLNKLWFKGEYEYKDGSTE